MTHAYYNEIDPFAAAWLRELIKGGHIAPGDVDERSIEDVLPIELAGYTQCHFFAGIGGWSLALRQAGWTDDCPVWTGSCPCQPFSAAGKGAGFDDERHLWPSFHWLIEQCRPAAVFGEQVASKATDTWIDLVQLDLEDLGYAFGAVAFPAASVGAPHIRDRTYWVADAGRARGAAGLPEPAQRQGRVANLTDDGSGQQPGAAGRPPAGGVGDPQSDRPQVRRDLHRELPREGPAERRDAGGLADALRGGAGDRPGQGVGAQAETDRGDGGLPGQRLRSGVEGASGRLAHSNGGDACAERQQRSGEQRQQSQDGGVEWMAKPLHTERGALDVNGQNGRDGSDSGRQETHGEPGARGEVCERPGPTNGFWRDADWLFCRDGKWRPVGPGTFPLAHGVPNRVGRLRGYGNSIVVPQAAEFVRAAMESVK